jgi:DNA-binding winged helix-turn-helix (wHTH) protein
MLVDRAGSPVTKGALIEAAWPGLAIEDSNLIVQIAALRRALGEVAGGESWIVTLPRKGDRFVGPAVTKSDALVRTTPTADPTLTSFIRRDAPGAKTRVSGQPQTLPAQLTRMVGREDSVQRVTEALSAHRFVTIVGPGGIGKTTVATAAAHALSPAFEAPIAFVDLGPLGEPRLVLGAIASTVGLMTSSAYNFC